MNKDNLIDSIGNIDEDILDSASEVRNNKKSGKGWIKWAAIAACLMIVGVGSFFVFRRVSDPVQLVGEITPTAVDKDGVYTNTQFLIDGKRFGSSDELTKQLSTNVDNKFDIEKTSEGNYLISFENELKSDSICNFFINDGNGNDRSYTFQVRADFAVKSFYPADSETVDEKSGIEVTFTTDAFDKYEEYITVIPDTPHKMEKIGNKVIITPETKWEIGKSYNVIVKQEMTDTQGRVLTEDYVSVYYVSSGHDHIRRSTSIDETFLTSDVPVIEVVCNTYQGFQGYDSAEYNLELYSFASADDYEKALSDAVSLDYLRPTYAYYESSPEYSYYDTNDMNLYLTANVGIVPSRPNDFQTSYIVLPDTLPEGYYLANVTCSIQGQSYRIQKLLQINDAAVYIRSSENSVLVWVNDSASGKAVAGADVIIDGENCGKTDSDGCFEFDHKYKKHTGMFRIVYGEHKPYITSILLSSKENKKAVDKYYSYLYTDRESYLATDKINVFGVIKPRENDSLPDKVTVCFGEIKYNFDSVTMTDYVSMDDSVFVKSEVELNDDGTFNAILPIDNFDSGYNRCVALKIGDEIITHKYITIENYVKPAYILNFDMPKLCLFAGEEFDFNINASYYGGIPAARETFSVSRDNGNTFNVTTDSNGNALATMKTGTYDNIRDGNILYDWISVTDESLLEKVQRFNQGLYVFPNNVMLESEIKVGENNEYTVNGLFSTIDLNKANERIKEFTFDISEDDYRGVPYDMTAKMQVHKVSFGEPSEYTYYDYINKCNVTTIVYNDNKTETIVHEEDIIAVNGNVSTVVPLEPIKNGYYYFSFSYKDANGREVVRTEFPTYDFNYADTSGIKTYYITDKDTVPSYCYDDYYLGEYKLGDKINLHILDENAAQVTEGKFLIGTISSRINENKIINGGKFDFEFSDKCVPSVKLTGAYFDGHRIFAVVTSALGYDYSEMLLEPEISMESAKYGPGSKVNIKVALKDAAGKSHKGSVNVSVVDEAQFAVAPQYASILSEFYRNDLSNVLLQSSVSYKQHSFYGAKDKGGEGGGGEVEPNPRQEFVDTAAFETVRTNSDGVAELTIELPDNITDWRITVNAISDDLYCGNSTKNISSSLPFVADMTMCSVFQSGDDVSVTAHVYGTAVTDNAATAFTAELTKPDGTKERLSDSATGHKFASINFGKLPVGTYSLKLTAKSSVGQDAIVEEFKVIESADEVFQFEDFELTDGIKLNATKSPVTLILGNANAKYVYSTLSKMLYSGGARYDQIIAADAAGRMLKSFADEEDKQMYELSVRRKGSLQVEFNGGVAVNSAADPDMFTTAFAAWCNPDVIDFGMIENYIKEHDEIEKYIALAAMNKPVLLEIKNNLAQLPEDDYYNRMVYICALAAIGDDVSAAEEFKKTFNEFIVVVEDGKAMLKVSNDDYVNDTLTAMAMTVLSITDRDNAAAMLNYLINKKDVKDFYGMQYVIYSKNILRGAYGTASFEYYSEGEKKSVTLNGAQTKTIKMTLEQLENAKFVKTEGNVSVTAYYTGNTENIAVDTSGKITKKYEFVGEPTIGGKVYIEMTLSVPDDKYITVTDYIPSGMRFSMADAYGYSNSWVVSQEGQKIIWGVCSKNGYARISYYVRSVAKGNFVFNNSYVSTEDGVTAVKPDEPFITIK